METAYPWPLCRAIATKMALHLQDLGVRCTTPKFAEQALRLEQIRHDTMFQTSSKALPLVSEFAQVVRLPAQQPLPPNARILSIPSMGEIASDGFKTVGIHRTPENFVAAALEANTSAPSSLEAVSQFRSEALRGMVAKTKELTHEEEELKQSLTDRRREVLSQSAWSCSSGFWKNLDPPIRSSSTTCAMDLT